MNATRAGQTLLESLLAIGIILIGIVSLISLMISLNQTSSSSLSQSVATQLAAEGMEGVHYLRDSNWLKIDDGQAVQYSDGLRSGTDYNGIYVWDPTSTDPTTAITVVSVSGGDITNADAIVYQDASDYYRQTTDSVLASSWTATKYRRWLTLYPVCRDTTATTAIFNTTEQIVIADTTAIFNTTEQIVIADGVTCNDFGANYEEVGIQARVTVQWPEPGRTVNYVIEEILYNWKYAQP